MRYGTIACCVACVLLAGAGCERKQPSDEPRAYDPAVDPPPAMMALDADPNVSADQVEIAQAVAGLRPAAPTGTPPAGTPAPGTGTPAAGTPGTPAAGTPGAGTPTPPTPTPAPVPPPSDGLPPVLPGEPGGGS